MAQYCIYAGKKTNCTDDCRVCLKEETDLMRQDGGYPEEEIKKFEQDWENQREQYAL